MSAEKKFIINKLRRRRRQLGYKQREVSKLLGLKSSARLARWEKGKSFPSVPNLLKLSALYSTLANDFYFELYLQFKKAMKKQESRFNKRKK